MLSQWVYFCHLLTNSESLKSKMLNTCNCFFRAESKRILILGQKNKGVGKIHAARDLLPQGRLMGQLELKSNGEE